VNSPLTKDREKTMAPNEPLSYDAFVSDPIPLLPNGERHIFSPFATTSIDAVLVGAPLTTEQAKAVGDWVEAGGKKHTHIFATDGYGDHCRLTVFGAT
jgi:hypothetical protein